MQVLMVYVVVVALLAAVAGRVAESRGRNFWVYFAFCVIVPVAALIAIPYLLVFTRRGPSE